MNSGQSQQFRKVAGDADADYQIALALSKQVAFGSGGDADFNQALQQSRRQIQDQEGDALLKAMEMSMQQVEFEESKEFRDAMEESKAAAEEEEVAELGPNPDRMTYEQLMELGQNNGEVCRGLTQEQIDTLLDPPVAYEEGVTPTMEKQCLICMENFQNGQLVRILPCKHVYDKESIDEWLSKEKRCPLCSKDPLEKQ